VKDEAAHIQRQEGSTPLDVWWRKSLRSNSQGSCLELASGIDGEVWIRDSKVEHGPELRLHRGTVEAFIRFVAQTTTLKTTIPTSSSNRALEAGTPFDPIKP
jgi:hypothetical protein